MSNQSNSVMSESTDKQAANNKPSYKTLLIENIKYRTLLTEKYKRKKPWEKKMTSYSRLLSQELLKKYL